MRNTLRSLILFGLAGIAGFAVDAGVLLLLKPWLGLYAGRLCSFLLAVLTTWLLNRAFAFKGRHSGLRLRAEFTRYLLLMIVGGLFNLGLYAALISVSALCQTTPVLAVAAGSLAGMVVNYLTARYGVFRRVD